MQIASISESFAPLLCLLTCGGFLAVVFHYASAFNRDVNAHRHILSQLSTPRFDLIQADKEFKWLHWLYSQTRNPKLAPPSRIEAMHEFDGLYFQRSDYTFVVRSREYAPFIGLLLTAFVAGFFYLFELENLDNASQGEMVRRVLPLLIGVAVGALLTLACSGIAQYINGTANTYRQDALEWFDYASRHARDALAEDAQNQIAAQITATNWNIADEISRFLAQALAKTEQVQCENEHLRQSATATMQAAESASASAARATTALEREIAKVCQNLSINISNLIDALSENAGRLTKFSDTHRDELHAISESTVELRKEWLTLQPEIRTIARGGASLAEATRTFSDAFGPAAEAIQSASQQYAHLTSVLGASAIAVNGATDRLQSAFVSHTAALQALNGSMQDSFIPSCCTLVASVEQLEHNTQHLNQHTQQMAISFDAASAGLKRFENVSNSFELAVDGQFVPAVTSLAELPNIIQSFRQSTDDAGRTLRDAGSAVQQAVEDHQNHLGTANASIESLQSLIVGANGATFGLNKSAASFSVVIQDLQQTSSLLSKVNAGLAPVSVQLEEFLNGLRNVASVSQNVDALVEHLRELDQVALEAAKAQTPLADFAKGLQEIQAVLRTISAERPGIWQQVLSKLGVSRF